MLSEKCTHIRREHKEGGSIGDNERSNTRKDGEDRDNKDKDDKLASGASKDAEKKDNPSQSQVCRRRWCVYVYVCVCMM
jgi:hypothetical protein